MSEENARRLMMILKDSGCKPEETIQFAKVQAWAEQNGFSDFLEEAIETAGEIGWIEDNSNPNDGGFKITPAGWENGNA